MSRVQRAIRQLPQSEVADTLQAPTYSPMLGTKAVEIQKHQHWVNSITPADICAYSDGSSDGSGRSSWGYVLERGGKTFKKGKGTLHRGEVYGAEIFGATMALRTTLSKRRNDEMVFVLLDNQAAVMDLNTGRSVSSIRLTKLFYGLAKSANVEYRWAPGHSRISGNEEADAEAYAALRDLPEKHIQPYCYGLTDLKLRWLPKRAARMTLGR